MNKVKKNLKELEIYGYTIVSKQISHSILLKIKKELIKIKKNKNKINFLLENKNQIILKNCFKNKPNLFLNVFNNSKIKKILQSTFKDDYILQSMNASLSKPYKKENIFKPHIDSKISTPFFNNTLHVGIAIAVDNFTKKNGSTRIWPFSHKSFYTPKEIKKFKIKTPEPMLVELKKGDMMIFMGHLWHTIGNNQTNKDRWGIFSFFHPWWIKSTWEYTRSDKNFFSNLNVFSKKILGFNHVVPSLYSKRNYTKVKKQIKSFSDHLKNLEE